MCYAFLADVLQLPDESMEPYDALWDSQWFMRGWTLVELLAPSSVIFVNKNWNIIGHKGRYLGRAIVDLTAMISCRTDIPYKYLQDAGLVDRAPADVKFQWTRDRRTTNKEDEAYCLLGLLNLQIPIRYGEGNKALARLHRELQVPGAASARRRNNDRLFSRRTRRFHHDEPLAQSSAIQDPYLILDESPRSEEIPEFMRSVPGSKSPLDDLVLPVDNHNATTPTPETPRIPETLHVEEPASVQTRTSWSTCWTIIMLATMIVGLSFTVGLYYSIARDRMGDGFTLAGWITTVGTFGLAVPITKHYPHCRCWKKTKTETLASA